MRCTAMRSSRSMTLRRFTCAEHGEDLLEYGLLAALIAIVAMGAVTVLGQQIYTTFWQTIANSF